MAKNIAVINNVWREFSRGMRFWFLPAYVAAPFAIFALHVRWWTLWLLIATLIAIFVLERYGYTAKVAMLAIRSLIAGSTVSRRRKVGRKYSNQ